MLAAELQNLAQLRDHVNMLLSVHPNARGTLAEEKVTAVINEALSSLHEEEAWSQHHYVDEVAGVSAEYSRLRGKKPFAW